MSSIWNLDLSKKGVNAKRKEKKALKKYTLFEQARKKSMMPRPSTLGEGMGNMFSQQSLLAGRGGMDQRRSTTVTQCGSGYPTLEPLGVDFKMNWQDNTSISSIAVPSVLRRMSRSRTLVPSKTPVH
ncbi:uncharacterized protein LOC134815595 [Bolinopsis microptera]|uniref:uncharacterized protein LOC134815595 n=1 Tax=Bolinopsis microptera TaxID=2820187 RepID=UPI00307AE708